MDHEIKDVMLVVLGLDSWDNNRYQGIDTPAVDSLTDKRLLKPFKGLAAGELVTQVLWPAMLYGKSPKTIWPEFYEQQSGYDNTGSNAKEDSSQGWSIEDLLKEVGRRTLPEVFKPTASNIGSKLGVVKAADEFDKHNAGRRLIERRESAVSAAEDPCLISIPGINEDMRNYDLNHMLNKQGAKNVSEFSLDVTAESYEQRAFELDAAHMAQTLQGVNQGHDLVWAHFAGLDFIQHMFSDSKTMMKRWYQFYDSIVSQVTLELNDDDTLVVVSDHGMEESGLHSHRAFFAANKELWSDSQAKMERLREVIELELTNHVTTSPTENLEMSMDKKTKRHLEDLGYIE